MLTNPLDRFGSYDFTYIAVTVDIITAFIFILAMQVITVRTGKVLAQVQRAAAAFVAICLLWNGVSNPSLHWFGEHHLAGFLTDISILIFGSVFVIRGLQARKIDATFRVEEHKQPADYIREFVNGGNNVKGLKQ